MTRESFAEDRCPEWARQAHRSLTATLRDADYPCYFGTQAERHDHIRYDLVTGDRYEHLADSLAEFVALSRENPRVRHLFVVFFDSSAGLAEDEARFWRLLQWLHEHDPEPWPGGISPDPESPGWEFCFAGDPMFAFPSLPGYRHRRSRRIGDAFAVCFQPRRIFAGVERDDPGGEAVRKGIYQRVREWDELPPHPDLEFLAYGDPEMREWKQYVLPDDNTPLRGRCPLRIADLRPGR